MGTPTRTRLNDIRPTDLIKCVRCGKSEFAGNAKGWNVVFDQGVVTCFLCPDCQTQDEFLEAEVNEAMTDYSKAKTINSIDELLASFRPLWAEALAIISNGEVERGNRLLAEHLERFREIWNAMNRYNIDAQIGDAQTAFALLKDMGEIGG